MAHALDRELHEYIERLNNEQKKSLLGIIRSFFAEGRVSVELYNQEIDAAMQRMQRKDYTGHDDIEKQAEEW